MLEDRLARHGGEAAIAADVGVLLADGEAAHMHAEWSMRHAPAHELGALPEPRPRSLPSMSTSHGCLTSLSTTRLTRTTAPQPGGCHGLPTLGLWFATRACPTRRKLHKSQWGEVRERHRPAEAIRPYNTASVHAEQLARVAPVLRDRANNLGGQNVCLPSRPPVSCLGGRPESVRRQPASLPTHSK